MARRKQNVDMYGKSWSPIDLPNLEKAIKLYERLNYLQDHFAGSLDGAKAIWDQINEKTDIQTELQKLGIKLTEEQAKEVANLLRQRQAENEEIKKGQKAVHNYSSSSSALLSRAGMSSSNGKVSWENAGYRTAQAIQQNYVDRQFKKNLEYYQNNARQMGKDPYSSLVSKLAQSKTVNDVKVSAGKFSAAGTALQVAAKTIKDTFNEFYKFFKAGIDNQANLYNSTFTNISVRTGMTNDQYFAAQRNARNDLYSQNLQNNISMSSVQEMWQNLANTGMNQEDILANALDNVITKTIVPYLDTTSESFNLINNRLDGNFSKQIRGISQASLEIAGNNYNTQELLTTIIDQVQPMSDEALENLAQGSSEVVAMINALTPTMGADAAKSYATQLFKAQKYSDQMLRSGTLDEKLAITGFLQDGINIYDSTQWNDAIASMIKNGMMYANWNSSGYSSTMSGLTSNMIASSVGQSPERMMAIYSLMQSGKSIDEILAETNSIDSNSYASRALASLANDENTTTYNEQTILMENLSTDFAIWKEQWGVWYDVATGLLKSIVGILGTYLAGKAISGIASGSGGIAGIGSSITGGITSFGGGSLATGLAGIAGVAAGGAMAIKGGTDVYNDISSGNVSWKTGASATGAAAGVAGAGALIALGASNPVGWVALGVGALALGARKIGEIMEDNAKMQEDSMTTYEAQINTEIKQREIQQDKYIKSLNLLKTEVEDATDIEEAKNLLVEAGIATEEQLASAQYKSKDALLELTDQYIASTKAMNKTDNDALAALKTLESKDKSQYVNDAKEYFDWLLGDVGWNREMYELSDTDRDATYKTIAAIATYGESNYDNMSDAEKKVFDKIKEFGLDRAKEGNSTTGLTWEEVDKIIDKMDSQEGATSSLITRALGDASILQDYSSNDSIIEKYGKSSYVNYDYSSAFESYLKPAHDSSTSDDKAAEYLKAFKTQTKLTWEDIQNNATLSAYVSDIMSLHNIESYKTGLNEVPYDNYPALLHEGEAVLTASTAYELRNLIDEYRESSNSYAIVEAAIQTQTVTLVEKLDQIIDNMNTGAVPNSSTLSEAYKSSKNILNSMVSMKRTKSAF